ncbi:MAG TPA: hypothetical protein VHX39_02045 [Acetobacteraceae bacterium]|nr:hypothetical protein [Acetobacteraceae bacterium]
MTVDVAKDGTIVLAGICPVEDADTLVQLLLADPAAEIDWRTCDQAHTAVVQVLLASHRRTRGPPRTTFLSNWVEPLLAGPVDPLAPEPNV